MTGGNGDYAVGGVVPGAAIVGESVPEFVLTRRVVRLLTAGDIDPGGDHPLPPAA